ncbi:MAG: hypothetical protein N3D10_04000 [Candidatus Micrarchaeota archaeon]|nr:hypothetical protein [Candidatus Micrarchaeota archaeon]
MHYYPINKPRIKLANNIKVNKVFFIGKKYDGYIVEEGIKRFNREIFYKFFSSKQATEAKDKIDFFSSISEKTDGLKVVFSEYFENSMYDFYKAASDIKSIDPNTIFCLISSDEAIITRTSFGSFPHIDYTFHYGGDIGVFCTILNFFEDKQNYKYDNERIVLVVEDKPLYYTRILNTLNFEISKGRTRNILARNYEEAEEIIFNFSERLAGAILDLYFLKGGFYGQYSWEVLKDFESKNIKIPIIFSSEDKEAIARIRQDSRVFALNKTDPGFLRKIRTILGKYGGFGPFVFRTPPPNEQDVAVAYSLNILMGLIKVIDDKILLNHAKDNHFSNWIWLQGYKELALKIRDIVSSDPEYIRNQILHYYHLFLKEEKNI